MEDLSQFLNPLLQLLDVLPPCRELRIYKGEPGVSPFYFSTDAGQFS